jgi:hypothetical protein
LLLTPFPACAIVGVGFEGKTMCAFEEGEIVDDSVKTFNCVKCKENIEYSEFFKHDDGAFDYGFYIVDSSVAAVGVEIVEGVNLCEYCVPTMYHNKEKNNG